MRTDPLCRATSHSQCLQTMARVRKNEMWERVTRCVCRGSYFSHPVGDGLTEDMTLARDVGAAFQAEGTVSTKAHTRGCPEQQEADRAQAEQARGRHRRGQAARADHSVDRDEDLGLAGELDKHAGPWNRVCKMRIPGHIELSQGAPDGRSSG